MKNVKQPGIISIALIILVSMAGLSINGCDLSDNLQTPEAQDYTVDPADLSQVTSNVRAVTITPKAGKSPGERTVYYNDLASGLESTVVPQSIGVYLVTFDVAPAEGWNAATDLLAGMLFVNGSSSRNPVATDFDIGNLSQTVGSVRAVTITPKAGKSTGELTIYYEGLTTSYSKTTTIPQGPGSYTVTFDVATALGWNAATGLSAGILYVNTNQTPVVSDYTIDNLGQIEGSVTAVTITPKTGKSSGRRTIYYEGAAPTSYTKTTVIPQAEGTYKVTFDVEAVAGWNEATGLSAGTLTVDPADGNKTPTYDDYIISNYTQSVNFVTHVVITPKAGRSPGAIRNIKYNGSTMIPQTVGTYTVTFDVAAATGWKAATGIAVLPQYNLVVNNNQTPKVDDYIWNDTDLWQTVGSVKTITITAKAGKSPGAIRTKYNGNTSLPANTPVGIYKVTIDVTNAPGWNVATDLYIGDLIVQLSVPGDNIKPGWPVTDDNKAALKVSPDNAIIYVPQSSRSPKSATLEAEAGVIGWYVNGVSVNQTGVAYTFTSSVTGKYTISVLVSKNNKLYSASIDITVNN